MNPDTTPPRGHVRKRLIITLDDNGIPKGVTEIDPTIRIVGPAPLACTNEVTAKPQPPREDPMTTIKKNPWRANEEDPWGTNEENQCERCAANDDYWERTERRLATSELAFNYVLTAATVIIATVGIVLIARLL